jgi:hypothetical protein
MIWKYEQRSKKKRTDSHVNNSLTIIVLPLLTLHIPSAEDSRSPHSSGAEKKDNRGNSHPLV